MDAREQDATACGSKDDGVSAEDEIQSFFAESSPSTATSTPAKPAKGSIESFFSSKKKADTSVAKIGTSQPQRSSPKELSVTSTSNRPRTVTPLEAHLKFGSAAKKASRVKGSKSITWSCSACTYQNTRRSNCKPFKCGICSTVAADGNIQTTSSESAGSANSTYESEVMIVDKVDSSDSNHDFPEASTSSGIIEIGDDSSDDDGDMKPAHIPVCSPFRSSSHQIVVIDDDEDEHKEADCLSFAVSKNSGRIAIHAATTEEEPLEVNFDVEQVLTESAADCLLEMQTKRLTAGQNEQHLLKSSVTFDDKAVSQCE